MRAWSRDQMIPISIDVWREVGRQCVYMSLGQQVADGATSSLLLGHATACCSARFTKPCALLAQSTPVTIRSQSQQCAMAGRGRGRGRGRRAGGGESQESNNDDSNTIDGPRLLGLIKPFPALWNRGHKNYKLKNEGLWMPILEAFPGETSK